MIDPAEIRKLIEEWRRLADYQRMRNARPEYAEGLLRAADELEAYLNRGDE